MIIDGSIFIANFAYSDLRVYVPCSARNYAADTDREWLWAFPYAPGCRYVDLVSDG